MRRRTLTLLLMVVVAFTSGCSSSSEVDEEVVEPIATGEPTADPVATPSLVPTEAAPTVTPVPPAPTAMSLPAPEATATPTATAEPTEPPTVQVLHVYWLRDGVLNSSGRVVSTNSPARNAVEMLLRGPDYAADNLGMETAVGDNVSLLDLSISDGTAIIDLSPEFEDVSFGTSGELAMVAQIVFTLTQFPTVDSVDIWIGGQERDFILSHGLVARGLTRDDLYDAVAPAIVVERPIPDEFVWAPFRASGFSRTFESNVQWELLVDGTPVASGFTTAEQPDVGRHGHFDFIVDVDDIESLAGQVRLSVFEESAKDGSIINAYEVPVFLRGAGPPPAPDEALPWLRADGIGPVDFGMAIQDAQPLLEETFGPPRGPIGSIDCESGTLGSLTWDGFQLSLSTEGTVEGWFYNSSDPPMMTASGIAIGTTRNDLVAAHPDVRFFRDTLSTEFAYDTPDGWLAGFVTDDGERVTELYAGWTCFFT